MGFILRFLRANKKVTVKVVLTAAIVIGKAT